MTKKQHPQQHLFPILSLLIVLVGIAVVVQSDIVLTAWHVTIASIVYLIANTSYALVKKQFEYKKLIEYILVAAFANYIALLYII